MVTEVIATALPVLPVQLRLKVVSCARGPTERVPDTATAPLQPPEAAHVSTPLLDQASVEYPPDATLVGDALSEALAADDAETVTLTLRVIELPLLEHTRVKMLVELSGPMVVVPTFGRLPDQSPEAEQLITFFADHLSCDTPPAEMSAGTASNVSVGDGAALVPLATSTSKKLIKHL
jgi:hypothetical protein